MAYTLPPQGAQGCPSDCLSQIPLLQYEGTVKKNDPGSLVTRLHVKDRDMQGSPAWQAVYHIKSGDPEGDFSITTDPKTNDGILRTTKVGPDAV